MAYAALISLRTTIKDVALSSQIFLCPTSVTNLKLVVEGVMSLRETMELLDESSKSNSRKYVNVLDERIKEAVWKFEDLLDSHVYDQIFPEPQILGGRTILEVHLHGIEHDIESFIKMLEEFKREYMHELDNLSPEEEVDFDDAVVSSVKNYMMVGESYAVWTFIKRQLEIKRSLDLLSLVGMGGVGKTTLARKVFDDPLIFTEFEFECRAWVTIGRKKWQRRKLIRDILIQLDPSNGGARNEGCYLNGILKAKRCLIVLDDVWDTDVWDHFKSSLPTYSSGRTLVLLTTRLQHVANSANAAIYTVELWNNDESWDLLRQRVFGEEDSCPLKLEKAGKKIAQKCDGLPSMIVTVADLLRQAEMTADYWEYIANYQNSSIFIAAYDRLSEVLYPSYEYLPQHLKPCFLYMGLLRQSCGISTSMLLNTWIAEGFVLSCINETIEECSETYMRDLFYHSVVIIGRRSVNYYVRGKSRKMKICRLHSCFWHLCKREATNTNFFKILTFLDDVENNMNTQRRLSVHNNILFGINNLSDFVGTVCASTTRSLLFYGPYRPYPVPICFNLRLLKVLDAIYISFYEFPIQVFQPVYLRFLGILYNGELPASISKLWNLQFLIINIKVVIKHYGVTSYMPIEVWDMKQLKHLQVVGRNLPNPSNGASLESLLKLKDVGVETCTKDALERIPKLRKLAIRIESSDDDDMIALHCLNHVHVLSELTSLKCTILNPILRSEIVTLPAPLPMLPSSLKKLHLSGTGYPWGYMCVIGSLPHLQVLKLGSYAFQGSEWVVKYGQFQTLNILKIEGTDLVKFKVELGGFNFLRVVHFSNCYMLEDIKWETNQCYPVTIAVTDCSTSTVDFANKFSSIHDSYDHVFSSYIK